MLWELAVAAAIQEIPPPRGVNGAVVGTADQFRVDGPARVCLANASIDLRPGEHAYLDYLGIHFGTLRVVGEHGTYLVTEGSFAQPRHPGMIVADSRGRTIERFRRSGRPQYYFYRQPEIASDDEAPVIKVEGDALGRSRDSAILSRINLDLSDTTNCRRRFVYGLDFEVSDTRTENAH